jgi:hypothetical protein
MAGRFALVRVFALIGFCNAVLIICLILYMVPRNLEAGTVLSVIVRILCPGLALDEDATSKIDYAGLSINSIFMNVCLYMIFGYLVVFTLEAWRRYFPRKKTWLRLAVSRGTRFWRSQKGG